VVYGLLLDEPEGPVFVEQYQFPREMNVGDTFTYGEITWEVTDLSTSQDAGGPGYEDSPYKALICRLH
jgi:hypothetical protein